MDSDEIQSIINGISEAIRASSANMNLINEGSLGQYKVDQLIAEIGTLQSTLLLVSGSLQIGIS